MPSQNTSKLLHCRPRRIGLSCKTVNYSHVISQNKHTVCNKVKNGFGRKDYHCVSQHPSVDGWHQLFKLKFYTPILRIGDQVLTFDVFWPKHLHEVRSTVYIHVQSIKQM